MLYPIIDVGSNTVKLSILDPDALFQSAPVYFKAIPLCLRTRVRDGKLEEKAISEVREREWTKALHGDDGKRVIATRTPVHAARLQCFLRQEPRINADGYLDRARRTAIRR